MINKTFVNETNLENTFLPHCACIQCKFQKSLDFQAYLWSKGEELKCTFHCEQEREHPVEVT